MWVLQMITTSAEASTAGDVGGKGMNCLKCMQENQGVISAHPGTGKAPSAPLWWVPVTSVQEQ